MRETLTKRQVLATIIGLIEVNDYDIIEPESGFEAEFCSPADAPTVRTLAAEVKDFHDTYDYGESALFRQELDGRGESAREMKLKIALRPEKKKEYWEQASNALLNIMENDDLRVLLPEGDLRFSRWREMLKGLSNPD